MATNFTYYSYFKEISDSLDPVIYDIDSIDFESDKGRYKISGDFTSMLIDSGAIIELSDAGDLTGEHSVISKSDGVIYISSSYFNNTGTLPKIVSRIYFFSEHLTEADSVVSGKGKRSEFIYMPNPTGQTEIPEDEPKILVKDAEVTLMVCTNAREYTDDGKQPITKLEVLDPAVARCREILHDFVTKLRASKYATRGNVSVTVSEEHRLNININTGGVDKPDIKRLFNSELTGVVGRMKLSLNKIKCNDL